jgi:hypothetical protein
MMSNLDGFTPTKFQRLAKAKFWRAVQDNPLIDPSALPDTEIERMVETDRIHDWKKDPGFLLWFTNDRTVEIAIEAGTEKAVQRLVEIIEAPAEARGDVTTTHQLAAIKTLLEYSSAKAPVEEDKPMSAEDLPDDEKRLLELIKKAALPAAVKAVPDE